MVSMIGWMINILIWKVMSGILFVMVWVGIVFIIMSIICILILLEKIEILVMVCFVCLMILDGVLKIYGSLWFILYLVFYFSGVCCIMKWLLSGFFLEKRRIIVRIKLFIMNLRNVFLVKVYVS